MPIVELLARTAEHDVLSAAFTPEGHLGYDLTARSAFTFRFLDSGEEEAWLTERGHAHASVAGPRYPKLLCKDSVRPSTKQILDCSSS